jgi:hypothetical protein
MDARMVVLRPQRQSLRQLRRQLRLDPMEDVEKILVEPLAIPTGVTEVAVPLMGTLFIYLLISQ